VEKRAGDWELRSLAILLLPDLLLVILLLPRYRTIVATISSIFNQPPILAFPAFKLQRNVVYFK